MTESGGHHLHLNTGAMALRALPADEESEFLDHLETCETCSPELGGFAETLGRLAVLTEQTPPASLRASVLAAVAITPQLPPMVADTGSGRHRSTQDEPQGPTAAPDIEAEVETSTNVVPLRRRWYQQPATLIAAAVIAIALAVGGVVIANRPVTQSPVASMESCVATANDAQVLTPSVGSGGTVRYAPSCGAATVTLPDVPAAPQGMGYQMWLMSGSDAAPVGMVALDPSGTPAPLTFQVDEPATDIGVSVEPAAGSSSPTSDPIWVVHLPA